MSYTFFGVVIFQISAGGWSRFRFYYAHGTVELVCHHVGEYYIDIPPQPISRSMHEQARHYTL